MCQCPAAVQLFSIPVWGGPFLCTTHVVLRKRPLLKLQLMLKADAEERDAAAYQHLCLSYVQGVRRPHQAACSDDTVPNAELSMITGFGTS